MTKKPEPGFRPDRGAAGRRRDKLAAEHPGPDRKAPDRATADEEIAARNRAREDRERGR